jgi:putative transposase
VKSGEVPSYPRFKPAHRFDSVLWPKDGDGAKWLPEASRVYLQGIGHVKVTQHREVEGFVKGRRQRRSQYPRGWTGSSGRVSGLKRSGRL